jgi:predicted nucleotidyltransferase
MATRTTAIEQAKQFIKDCVKSGMQLSSAYLYGSYAKNTAREDSDIDILLVSNQFSNNRLQDVNLYANVNIHYPKIEVFPCSADKFNSNDDFVNEIMNNSIKLI